MKTRLCAFLFAISLSHGASAVMLDVADGRLMGATDVDVNGTLYDVRFIDGLFGDIFGVAPTFIADNFFDARQFGQALIDSVLLNGPSGMFDTQVDLTNGCPDPTYCTIETPYGVADVFPFNVSANAATNLNLLNPDGSDSDNALSLVRRPAGQSTIGRTRVFAVWTPTPVVVPVPEPSILVLLGIGLAGMGFARKKTKA